MALGGFTGSNAEAEIDYVNASTDIFLDYDSKNREFYFSVPLADAHATVIVKPGLSDAFALLDSADVHPLKSPSDSVTVSDAAYRVLTKALADGFALDDGVLTDKDYIRTKGNVATMSDVLGLSYGHVVADSYSMSDVFVQVCSYVRTFNDPIVLTDSERNPLGTFILNTSPLNASDSQFALTKGNDQVDTLGPFSDAIAFTFISLTSDSIIEDMATVSDTINLSHVSGGVLNAVGVSLNNVTLN
jgi:hypothetical protein